MLPQTITTRADPPTGYRNRTCGFVSPYATSEAARAFHATGNNRKNGPLCCDLCSILEESSQHDGDLLNITVDPEHIFFKPSSTVDRAEQAQ